MKLDNPNPGIPRFNRGDDYDSNGGESSDRFNPFPLSSDEIIYLKNSLNQDQRRRRFYRPGLLRVYVEGLKII